MREIINKARKKLSDGEYTCVVLLQNEEYVSRERGVKPLLELLKTEKSFCGAVAADKTVGAGAAHLYVLLGVSALWANVISFSAEKILRDNKITVLYDKLVPHIINRKGDGICPIESAVAEAKSSNEAYYLIVDTLKRLQQNQSTEEKAQAIKIFKALSDESRLDIMDILASGEKCGCELLEAMKISQPTLSHHMHILCDAGLVDSHKEGKWIHYSLSSVGATQIKSMLEKYASQ